MPHLWEFWLKSSMGTIYLYFLDISTDESDIQPHFKNSYLKNI